MKISDMMSTPVHSVSSGKSVKYVSNLMNELNIGSMIVVDDGIIVGITTSRNVRSSHPNRIIADAMTAEPFSISSDAFAWEALNVMEQHEIKRLLVEDDNNIVGIVTRETLKINLKELIDPMTGLYRAPYIQTIGEDLLEKRISFYLFFIDLNNFGEINKMYGHPVGDDIIQGFADRLRSLTAEEDFLCRYAGDEFVIITLREDSVHTLLQSLAQDVTINDIQVSAAVGWIDENKETDFFSIKFRDMLSKVSLMSSSNKRIKVS
ncbi:MAG: diguanylate cyclase protein [Bacilli bacterium]|nr:diguanylate cyclase protein [Bacilli bacterium]